MTWHEASRGLDVGAKGCPVSEKADPSSEEWAKEGLSRGAWVTRTKPGWASVAQLTGPAPRPPWLCTGSVREGSLGEMHICEGPGASCVPVHPCRECPRSGNKTSNGSSPERQIGLPVRLRRDPKSARTPGDGVIEVIGPMWMARSDLRYFYRLQRRRWWASCHMRRECRPPWRLMYATVAVLSVQISTCLPCSSPLRRPSARCTANNSRQLMWQCSRGPIHRPGTAYLLYVAPQPVAEASVKTTACLERKGLITGWRFGDSTEWWTPGVCSSATPILGLGCEACAEEASYEATRAALLQLQMPYAPGASEKLSVGPLSCLWTNSGSSTLTGRTSLCVALSG